MRKIALFFLLLTSFLVAEEEKIENYIIVPRGETIEGDYFAAGNTVEISGHVTGDLYVTGSRIFIDGVVDGDVLFLCGEITISGHIKRDLRGSAGHVEIVGSVDGGVSALAISLDLASRAQIDGSLVAVAATTDLASKIGRDANIFSSYLRVSDQINGNLYAHVAKLRITSNAQIGKNLHYWSNDKALIDKGARIKGKLVHEPSFLKDITSKSFLKKIKIGSTMAVFMMNLFYSFLIGLVLLRYYRPKIDASIANISTQPVRTFFVGVLIAICLPIASLIFLLTIVGAPFALTLVALNVIGFYLAKVLFILWALQATFGRTRIIHYERTALFFTLVIYLLLVHIPYVGILLSIVATLTGVGSVALGPRGVAPITDKGRGD